jgi:hypothetical protein
MTTLIPKFEQTGSAINQPISQKLAQFVSAYDYMTDDKIASAKAGTLSNADALIAVQNAVDAVHAIGGGTVYVPQGVVMGTLINNLNLYGGVNPTAPVMVQDSSRSDHIAYYSGTNDVEYIFMGPTAQAGGPNTPAVRIHNYGKDGLRNPIQIFSYGEPADGNGKTQLGWVIAGSNDGNAHSNVPAHDLVIAGGQGGTYSTGTAAVNSASATVIGTGTAWTSDFVGAIFTVNAQSNAAGIVKSVESATSLTLQSTWGTYNGVTASTGAYLLQGGQWTGTLTSDYKARLILGQNYTWLFNASNYSGGTDYNPLTVANGTGNYPANISYIFNGNKTISGINPATLLKVDNGSSAVGNIGFILTGGAYAGTPTRCLYLDKATNTFYITNALDGVGGISIGADGVVNFATGFITQQKTTAQISDKTDAINTSVKFAGKQIWNSSTNVPLWAQGSTATSSWVNGAGTVIITPA